MRYIASLAILLFGIGASAPVFAQGRGGGHASAPKTHAEPKAPKVPTTTHAQPSAPKDHGPKVAHVNPKKASPTTTTGTTPTSTATTNTATNTTTTTTPVTTTVTTTTDTSVFVKNPKLEARLKTLLPTGTNMNDASKGFKNWGQFVAAAHVSNNLDIPFSALKAKMTGTNPMSLGQAIQATRGTTTTPVTVPTTPPSTGTTTTTTTTNTTTTTTTTTTQAVTLAEQQAAEDFRRAR